VAWILDGTRSRDLSSAGLLELCKRFDVDEIVVAVDDRRRSFPIRELLECRLAGVACAAADRPDELAAASAVTAPTKF
jgi:hypothetical protein